jgi:ArsR family transcriptional regulator, arsenate/arsenite/antimonite-responsive transcriptional repressor
MREFMAVAKALSDQNRVRALLAVMQQELCVCQIIELLELAPSTVSKHMAILKQARLVDSRKQGRWIYYRLADDDVPAVAQRGIQWVAESLASDPRNRQDIGRLKRILKVTPETLCAQQASGPSGCTP